MSANRLHGVVLEIGIVNRYVYSRNTINRALGATGLTLLRLGGGVYKDETKTSKTTKLLDFCPND